MSEEKLKEPSAIFMRAICDYGTPQASCEFCGRIHFATGSNYIEPADLERLRARAKEQPDLYIEDPESDGLSMGVLDNRQVVWGCPCNRVRRYEDFIWEHRFAISRYLKAKAEELAKQAKLELENASSFNEF